METKEKTEENETKKETFWGKVKTKAKAFGEKVKENQETILTITGLIVTVVTTAVGAGITIYDHKENRKELQGEHSWQFDEGQYAVWHTKRPLTNIEIREYRERINNGEKGDTILEDMGLLEL